MMPPTSVTPSYVRKLEDDVRKLEKDNDRLRRQRNELRRQLRRLEEEYELVVKLLHDMQQAQQTPADFTIWQWREASFAPFPSALHALGWALLNSPRLSETIVTQQLKLLSLMFNTEPPSLAELKRIQPLLGYHETMVETERVCWVSLFSWTPARVPCAYPSPFPAGGRL